MANVAEVYYPSENCRFSGDVLRFIHIWKDELKIDNVDVVHWNAGLWDTLRIYGDDIIVKPDVHADYVERIMTRLKFLFPGVKIIFATSTPVIESGFIEEFEMRYNSDVEEYNRIACEIVKKRGGIINDLYTLLKDVSESYHSDQTHFYMADAMELIGGQVNRVLCQALEIDANKLIVPDKMKYHQEKPLCDKDMFIKRGDYWEKVLGI